MFTCQLCSQPQEANVPSRRVPTKKRPVVYLYPHGMSFQGTEIVEEVLACRMCPDPIIDMLGKDFQAGVTVKEVFHDPKKSGKKQANADDDRQRRAREDF